MGFVEFIDWRLFPMKTWGRRREKVKALRDQEERRREKKICERYNISLVMVKEERGRYSHIGGDIKREQV